MEAVQKGTAHGAMVIDGSGSATAALALGGCATRPIPMTPVGPDPDNVAFATGNGLDSSRALCHYEPGCAEFFRLPPKEQ